MLKMPEDPQQCSSSPIRGRLGSVDSVVLPVPDIVYCVYINQLVLLGDWSVPDKPKNSVTSPCCPTLQPLCRDRTPRFGIQ